MCHRFVLHFTSIACTPVEALNFERARTVPGLVRRGAFARGATGQQKRFQSYSWAIRRLRIYATKARYER
jgi:hypothetical protein